MKSELKKIFDYWENNAKKFKSSYEASWGDTNMIALEIETISKYIPEGSKILDAGCANGYSTLKYLSTNPNSIVAFDYSLTMIKSAFENLREIGNPPNVRFYEADILDIPEENESFDVSITTRVLINLANWNLQKDGLNEIIRVTRKGGTILISEAFWGSFSKINNLRKILGLKPLIQHEFNTYLKEDKLEQFLNMNSFSFEVINFSSLYYIGSRAIRELYLNKNEEESYNHFINDFFFELEQKRDKGDFGIQKLYVVQK